MTIHAWRIVKAKHASGAFTGEGAQLAGGRWTSPGLAVVHVADSVALAVLERLVHLRSEELLLRYMLFEVTFDGSLVTNVDVASLPKNWRASKPPAALQRIGDAWHAARYSAVFRVPSVVVPAQCNYLLNPAHADFAKITIGPAQWVRFDRRLIRE